MVRTAAELGWERVSNDVLLSAAEEAGFDVFLSGDRNIPSQQAMKGRKLAVLCMTANNWPIVQPPPSERSGSGGQRGAGNGEGRYGVASSSREGRPALRLSLDHPPALESGQHGTEEPASFRLRHVVLRSLGLSVQSRRMPGAGARGTCRRGPGASLWWLRG